MDSTGLRAAWDLREPRSRSSTLALHLFVCWLQWPRNEWYLRAHTGPDRPAHASHQSDGGGALTVEQFNALDCLDIGDGLALKDGNLVDLELGLAFDPRTIGVDAALRLKRGDDAEDASNIYALATAIRLRRCRVFITISFEERKNYRFFFLKGWTYDPLIDPFGNLNRTLFNPLNLGNL